MIHAVLSPRCACVCVQLERPRCALYILCILCRQAINPHTDFTTLNEWPVEEGQYIFTASTEGVACPRFSVASVP